jgi:hypothetical protein
MSDTSSEYEGYQILNIEEMEKAKEQVISNYMCKKCNIPFCGECAKTVSILKMCSKSIPNEIIENISSNIRCDECTEMIDTIKNQLYKNENGIDLGVYDIKLYYYKEFNEFPTLRELKDEENELLKNLSQTNYDVLNILFKHLGNEKQLKHWKNNTIEFFWDTMGESLNEAYDSFVFLFEELLAVLVYIGKSEIPIFNHLYSEGFGFEIADKLNDLFFSDACDDALDDNDDDTKDDFRLLENYYF